MGTRVTLVPPGHEGMRALRSELAASDAAGFDDFYGRTCGFERLESDMYRCGDTLICSCISTPPRERFVELRGTGFRYLTVQVCDCDAEHRGPPGPRCNSRAGHRRHLGTTARFSFIRDPDGNWIENLATRLAHGPAAGLRPKLSSLSSRSVRR